MGENSQYNFNNLYYSSMLSNPFSSSSYLSVKEKSGRCLSYFEEPAISEYERMKNIKNTKPFQILDDSKFYFHTNKKGSNPNIICDEIIIHNEKTNYSLEEITHFSFDEIIKQFPFEAETLKNNYKKFLNVLIKILNEISTKFSFQYKLRFILQFKTNGIENNKFKIECIYTAYIPNENPFESKDDDILEKGLTHGFIYLLDEINNEQYNDLNYED